MHSCDLVSIRVIVEDFLALCAVRFIRKWQSGVTICLNLGGELSRLHTVVKPVVVEDILHFPCAYAYNRGR